MSMLLRVFAMLGLLGASEDRFAQDMLRRLRAALPGHVLTLKNGDTIVVDGSDDWQMYLTRLRKSCQRASKAECEASKRAIVQTMMEKPVFSPDRLRVIVRDVEWIEGAWGGKGGAKEGPLILRPIGDDLYAVLVSEQERSVATVSRQKLKEMGLESRTAWSRARQQTDAELPALPTADQLHQGLVLFEGHEFGATLLTRKAAWRRLSVAVGSDMIVTVVSDHLVLVGIKPDGPDLDAFKKVVAEDCEQQERCVSPHVYRFRDGRWVIAGAEPAAPTTEPFAGNVAPPS